VPEPTLQELQEQLAALQAAIDAKAAEAEAEAEPKTKAASQKNGKLEGGTINQEILDSSEDVLKSGGLSGQKGLQQYFTPPEVAKFIYSVIVNRYEPRTVFDPTAGNGALIADFETTRSFGVEIDPDQIEASEGHYQAIQGDFQKLYPLLNRTVEFETILLNPPFGLQWEIPGLNKDKPGNSTLLAIEACSNLLSEDGQFVLIAGTGRLRQNILGKPGTEGIYAIINVSDLFPGTTTPASICFGVHPEQFDFKYRWDNPGKLDFTAHQRDIEVANLDLLEDWVLTARNDVTGGRYFHGDYRAHPSMHTDFGTIRAEYKRQNEGKQKASNIDDKAEFDVTLYGGNRIQCEPSPYTTLILKRVDKLHLISRLNGSPVDYFIQNEREWIALKELERDKLISIHKDVHAAIGAALEETYRVLCPMYPVSKAQRLGFLSDVSTLLCTKDAPDHGFEKGVRYDLDTRTGVPVKDIERKAVKIQSGKRAGEFEDRIYTITRKVMKVTVGNWSFTDSEEDSENIQFLIDHFEMPDPGDARSRFPEELEQYDKLLQEVEDEVFVPFSTKYHELHPEEPIVRFIPKQKDDLSRILWKNGGLVAWEQGAGKTIAGCAFAEAKIRSKIAQDKVLIICPGDLIPQWRREIERLTGRKLTHIKRQAQAKKIAKELDNGGTGWYITHPEALSQAGMRGKNGTQALPHITVEEKLVTKIKPGTDKYGQYYTRTYTDDEGIEQSVKEPLRRNIPYIYEGTDPPKGEDYIGLSDGVWKYFDEDGVEHVLGRGHIPAQIETSTKAITSKDLCPNCKANRNEGWNGVFCSRVMPDGSKCAYAHYAVRIKPVASYLSTCFRKGVVILDEATKMQGEASAMSLAIRGIRCHNKLAMTGTPIKNYVKQLFWVAWWALGNASKRFPYNYDEQDKFEENFCVFESYTLDGEGTKKGAKSRPEVTNLSLFWRMIASSIIRRRIDDFGIAVPPVYYHPVSAPYGVTQQKALNKWAKCFVPFFIETHPDSAIAQYPNLVEIRASTLGLNQKFEWSEIVPEEDPHATWNPDEKADPQQKWQNLEVSNYTPGMFKAMELTMALVKQGRKVLFGSSLIPTGKFAAECLQTKGIRAVHIVDNTGKTQNKEKRAETVHAFQKNKDVDVLCTTVQAIRLGHNLSAGSAVVIYGLPWDFETLDQFAKRVRRMSSRRPIDVYIVLPGTEGLTDKKWQLLNAKGQAADLALDGHLTPRSEIEKSQNEVIQELIEKGVPLTGNEVDETLVYKLWQNLQHIDQYEIPERLLAEAEPSEELAAWAVGAFIQWTAKGEAMGFDLDTDQEEEFDVEDEENEVVLESAAALASIEALSDIPDDIYTSDQMSFFGGD
jgi:SNF2-related domain/Helicase conserved C-terminal domain